MKVETQIADLLPGGAIETSATALWYEANGQVVLKPASIFLPSPDHEAGEHALVRTLYSAISRGSERLIFEGRVPASEEVRMRAPHQEGDFPFPVKYGYCAVGRVDAGPKSLIGQIVFALYPHQDRFVLPVSALMPVPAHVPPRRATLAANMETALNAIWDSGAGPGDRIVIVGAGTLGLLIGALATRLPGAEVIISDIDPARKALVESLGANFRQAGAQALPIGQADVVFHTSASARGLEAALSAAAPGASVVEVSWYGDGKVLVPLGGMFHSQRLRLIASQVGSLPPLRQPRWTHVRRLAKALDLLADDRLDALLTQEIAFADTPRLLPDALRKDASGIVTLIAY